MATTTIGDIHGNFEALEDLLEKLLPSLRSDDILVFLGDYIDRGPNSKACVERIIELKKRAAFSVVTLMGNHEEWLLKCLRDPTSHSWVLGMEAFETIASYSLEAASELRSVLESLGPDLVFKKPKVPYELFFDTMPQEHLAFFQSLTLYFKSEDVICVHAGLKGVGEQMAAQEREALLWGVNGFPENYRGDLPVVYGHWNDGVLDESGWPSPRFLNESTFGIDTIAHGVLTAIRFPDLTVIQSARFS